MYTRRNGKGEKTPVLMQIEFRRIDGVIIGSLEARPDLLLRSFVTDVSDSIGVPERSLRFFLPDDEFLPAFDDIDPLQTIEDAGLEDNIMLRFIISGLRRHESDTWEIDTWLPKTSQFLLWAVHEKRYKLGLAILEGSPALVLDGSVEDAVVARTADAFMHTSLMLAAKACKSKPQTRMQKISTVVYPAPIIPERPADYDEQSVDKRFFRALLAAMTNQDVELMDEVENTALDYTEPCYEGNRFAEMIIARMSAASMLRVNEFGKNQLRRATLEGNLEKVARVYEANPAALYTLDINRETVFHDAIYNTHILEFFLSLTPPMSLVLQHNVEGQSPFHVLKRADHARYSQDKFNSIASSTALLADYIELHLHGGPPR